MIEGETSNSLIKGVSLGSLPPGAKVHKTLLLRATGGEGDRTLDISVQSRPSGSAEEEGPTTETLQTLIVPVVAAFKTVLDVAYRRSTASARGIADPNSYDVNYWDDADGGEAIVTAHIECPGPWEIEIEEIQLVKKVDEYVPFFPRWCLI
jgi:trafficking protein particle complex subunit 11